LLLRLFEGPPGNVKAVFFYKSGVPVAVFGVAVDKISEDAKYPKHKENQAKQRDVTVCGVQNRHRKKNNACQIR